MTFWVCCIGVIWLRAFFHVVSADLHCLLVGPGILHGPDPVQVSM